MIAKILVIATNGHKKSGQYLTVSPSTHPTMASIMAAATVGQTVLLNPGTYASGGINKAVNIKALDPNPSNTVFTGGMGVSGITGDIILEGFSVTYSSTWGITLSIYNSNPASSVYVNKCRIIAGGSCYGTGCNGSTYNTKLYMTYCNLFRGYAHTVYANKIGYLSLYRVLVNTTFYPYNGSCDVSNVSTVSTNGYGIGYGDYLINI